MSQKDIRNVSHLGTFDVLLSWSTSEVKVFVLELSCPPKGGGVTDICETYSAHWAVYFCVQLHLTMRWRKGLSTRSTRSGRKTLRFSTTWWWPMPWSGPVSLHSGFLTLRGKPRLLLHMCDSRWLSSPGYTQVPLRQVYLMALPPPPLNGED